MKRGVHKRVGMLIALCVLFLGVGGAFAQGYQGYYYQDDYWGKDYRSHYRDPQVGIGRTLGGAVGLAAGGFAGAALASAVIGAAGIGSLGSLATILVGTSITMACGLVGSKLFSHVGQWADRTLGRRNLWTMMGATIGTILAVALLPATGPFAGVAGMIAKGFIGGIAGGILGRLFAPQLQAISNPRILYAAAGGLMGALGGGGIVGAVAGVALGGIVGTIMDKNFFSDERVTMGDLAREGGYHVSRVGDWFRRAGSRISDWFHGGGNWVRDRWYGDDPYYQGGYYDDYYYNGYQIGYGYGDYSSGYDEQYAYTPGFYVDYGQGGYAEGDLYDRSRLRAREYLRLQEMMRTGASPDEIRDAYRRYGTADRYYREGFGGY